MQTIPTKEDVQLAWRVLNWIQARGSVRKEDAIALRRCATAGHRMQPLDAMAREIIEAAKSDPDLSIHKV